MNRECDREPNVDASLLRVLTAQFVARDLHPQRDIDQFERLALGLVEGVDAAQAADVAIDLCRHFETPPSVVFKLFEKGGACAHAALEHARTLPQADLKVRAEYGPTDEARAIARRAGLDRELAGLLAQRPESAVLHALAANPDAILDPTARRALVQAGRDDPALGRLLLARSDIDIDPAALYLAAGPEDRLAILLGACRETLAAPIADVTPRIEASLLARLEAAAIARDPEALAAALADGLDCRKGRVRAMTLDDGGEPLALALAALGTPPDAAARILMCGAGAYAQDHLQIRALVTLMRSTPSRAAMQIVAAITGAPRPEREATRRSAGREETSKIRHKPATRAGQAEKRHDRTA